jgi:hypothetical protein
MAVGELTTYIRTYYPNTTESREATPVVVQAALVTQHIDFDMASLRLAKISGHVFNSSTGRPMTGGFVTLQSRADDSGNRATSYLLAVTQEESTPEDTSLLSDVGYHGRVQDSNGYFEIAGVPPGAYWAYAGVFDDDNMYIGNTAVEVGDKDLGGVVVKISEGVNLEGWVNTTPEGAVDFSTLAISLVLDDHPLMGRNEARPRANGSFTLRNITPGTYQVRVQGLRGSYFVQAVRHGGGNVLARGLTVDGSTSEVLDIDLSSRSGSINGVVTTDGKPVRATVLLAPEIRLQNRLDLYVTTHTGPDGAFRLQGLSPGNFKLWAFENLDEDLLTDPVLVQELDASGVPVAVIENRTESVNLDASRTPDDE